MTNTEKMVPTVLFFIAIIVLAGIGANQQKIVWKDDFNDNSIDIGKWSAIQIEGWVYERNQRLECEALGMLTTAGLRTNNKINLQNKAIQVDIGILNGNVYGLIVLVSPIANYALAPHTLANSYGVLYSQLMGFEAFKIVDGKEEVLSSAPIDMVNGDKLRMEVATEIRLLYYASGQWHTLFGENFGLPLQCYVYIYAYSSLMQSGLGYFDNFSIEQL